MATRKTKFSLSVLKCGGPFSLGSEGKVNVESNGFFRCKQRIRWIQRIRGIHWDMTTTLGHTEQN